MNTIKDLLEASELAARQAADFLRGVRRPSDPGQWSLKGPNDFVTEIDRHAETLIRETLLKSTPGASVLGEELSPDLELGALTWIIDPLDGTTNFLHGYPACAVSIAAAVDGVVEVGVVHRLEPDTCYRAVRGGGAWDDAGPLEVSTRSTPAHALIGTGFPFKCPEALPEYLAQFRQVLLGSSGIRRAGSAALDLADVAAGRFEGFWEVSLAPWDVAAGALLVREAGGIVTDLAGDGLRVGHGPVVAGNPAIHGWLLEIVGKPDRLP
jgi:myo-inositol-1(or 4)-monophosphatase